MNKIKSIQINTSKIPTTATSRTIAISGDPEAVVSLQVSRADGRYYNFLTNSFTAAYTSANRLSNKKIESTYSTSINFPASSSGDTYTFWVWADPHFKTELAVGGQQQKTKYLWKQTVSQASADATITFTWDYSQKAGVASLPFSSIGNLATSTGNNISSYTAISAPTVSYNNSFRTSLIDADAGVKLRSPIYTGANIADIEADDVLFVQTGATDYQTTDASLITGGTVELNTVDNLQEGMYIHSIQDESITSNTHQITSIDTDTNTITVDTSISDIPTYGASRNVVFNGYGIDHIRALSGISIANETIGQVELNQLSKTLRTRLSAAGPTIDISNTTGVSRYATVRSTMINNASNASAAAISSVSQSASSSGTITVTNAEFNPAPVGTIIYIDGYSNNITIDVSIKILKYPTSNQVIYFDLTKILTAGVGS